MEVIPFGTVHVVLKRANNHYRWNKVTTCIHNIFKGQRWVDQYGEMSIVEDGGRIAKIQKNHFRSTKASSLSLGELTCKLTFEKASYWSNKKHEVTGTITNRNGEVVERLFGKWNEAIYCGSSGTSKCVWRPGIMPSDHELYYGFSRFAIELNELTPELKKELPGTDTRFRPDQR